MTSSNFKVAVHGRLIKLQRNSFLVYKQHRQRRNQILPGCGYQVHRRKAVGPVSACSEVCKYIKRGFNFDSKGGVFILYKYFIYT